MHGPRIRANFNLDKVLAGELEPVVAACVAMDEKEKPSDAKEAFGALHIWRPRVERAAAAPTSNAVAAEDGVSMACSGRKPDLDAAHIPRARRRPRRKR